MKISGNSNVVGQHAESDSNAVTADCAVFKVRLAVKVAAFCASVLALSWFFEGWREIHKAVDFYSVSVLIAGILCTSALIGLQSFWVYAEEKQKGALLRRIGLFEKFYEKIMLRQANRQAQEAKRGEKAKHAY